MSMVIALTGTNSFLLEQELATLTAKAEQDYGANSVERIDAEGAEAEEVLARLNAVSLFSDNSLLVLKGLNVNRELSEKLAALLNDQLPANDLIIIEPTLDRRGKLYSVLKSKATLKDFSPLQGPQLSRWVGDLVKQKGGSISLADSSYLVDQVGTNQEMLAREVEKLLLYDPKISQDTINKLVEPSPSSTVFNLINAAFSRDHKRVVRIYAEQQTLRMDHHQFIGLLAWQLHIIALAKLAGDTPLVQVAAKSGVNEYQLSNARKLSAKIELSELTSAINRLLEIDVKSKSRSIDIDDALLYFLLSI